MTEINQKVTVPEQPRIREDKRIEQKQQIPLETKVTAKNKNVSKTIKSAESAESGKKEKIPFYHGNKPEKNTLRLFLNN